MSDWRVIAGDCIEAMAAMPESSVDAIVTDPPYGLGFMGKEWDKIGDTDRGARVRTERAAELTPTGQGHSMSKGPYLAAGIDSLRSAGKPFQVWCETWGREALRVLRPGGYILAFGGTRTYHRLTCAIEDAGFEIRDCLAWLYGSGFPKSLDVSKAIDKAAGAERETVGRKPVGWGGLHVNERLNDDGWEKVGAEYPEGQPITAPATPDAEQWNGWGTALKPAHEPIVLARKPLTGTVAVNVLEHGTGALNVDGCRIASDDVVGASGRWGMTEARGWNPNTVQSKTTTAHEHTNGRWPANVLLDPEAAALLDEQTGELHSQDPATRQSRSTVQGVTAFGTGESIEYADRGGASRFFYCAKAGRDERNAGLDGFEQREAGNFEDDAYEWPTDGRGNPRTAPIRKANVHPTVKPIDLMRWLCRLITPPGGTVLDPFTGSGTTGCAAVLEDFDFIGIDRERDYVAIAEARIAHWWKQPVQLGLEAA